MPRKKKEVVEPQSKIEKVENPTTKIPKEEKPLMIRPGKGEGVAIGTKYLVTLNGIEKYMSASAIEVALVRQQANQGNRGWKDQIIEIPKGSPFVVPESLKGECKGCG